jgi:hypothetical protein
MKWSTGSLFVLVCSCIVWLSWGSLAGPAAGQVAQAVGAIAATPALEVRSTAVYYRPDSDLLVFEQQLNGVAGSTVPQPAGQLDGAPVLGYVFPTTLKPEDVGFGGTEGLVALAITSHPDFDDTPLWDENNDRDYTNDGVIWHSHWVVLRTDDRVPGGLSVKEVLPEDASVVLPPTSPGLPMLMDSPGFAVTTAQNRLRVLVPAQRINHVTTFKFDAVTAYLEVNTSDAARPMLGVYQVYSIGSGDLSLPYSVQTP